MKVLLLSMFYADAAKHLADRAFHLYRKPAVTRWVLSVRPGRDCTAEFLAALANFTGKAQDEAIIFQEPDEQPEDRLERLSLAGDRLLATVADEDYVLWHESDLFTLGDVVERLAALRVAVAGGWPVLSHDPANPQLGVGTPKRMVFDPPFFYDSWGYRQGGKRFGNHPPYHDCYRPEPFRLDSVGSVVLVDADYIRRGARMRGNGLVGLCESVREMNGEVWCDPRVPVVQPAELWTINDD
jgi:hypothetical protein